MICQKEVRPHDLPLLVCALVWIIHLIFSLSGQDANITKEDVLLLAALALSHVVNV